MVPIDRFDRVECGPSARDACWRVRLHAVVRSCLYSNLPNPGSTDAISQRDLSHAHGGPQTPYALGGVAATRASQRNTRATEKAARAVGTRRHARSPPPVRSIGGDGGGGNARTPKSKGVWWEGASSLATPTQRHNFHKSRWHEQQRRGRAFRLVCGATIEPNVRSHVGL